MLRFCARLLPLLTAAPAMAFDLGFPLDCTLGDTCFIQQYADRDPGPSAQDFSCGPLVYDGHEGTDFALPDMAAMDAGVTVRAAAAGIVKGARDGMPDILIGDPKAPPLDGRDCGNGVLIEHEGGWQTQYCHLKQFSITVNPGDPVAEGATLGQVGLSGNTEFPHLHISVRKDGTDIDPFDPDGTLACGTAAPQLWADPIPYQPGGIIGAGIATDVPTFEMVNQGLPGPATFPPDAPALILWAAVFGGQAGDQLSFGLIAPGGRILSETVTLEKTQARLFRAVGKRLTAARWQEGSYLGEVIHQRGTAEISRRPIAFRIGP